MDGSFSILIDRECCLEKKRYNDNQLNILTTQYWKTWNILPTSVVWWVGIEYYTRRQLKSKQFYNSVCSTYLFFMCYNLQGLIKPSRGQAYTGSSIVVSEDSDMPARGSFRIFQNPFAVLCTLFLCKWRRTGQRSQRLTPPSIGANTWRWMLFWLPTIIRTSFKMHYKAFYFKKPILILISS